MVGVGGLEPPTSSLSETRSNQLSYTPIISKYDRIIYLYTQSNEYTYPDSKCKTFLFFHTKVVPGGGIEPPTRWFSVICSTNWAILAYCNINPQSCYIYNTTTDINKVAVFYIPNKDYFSLTFHYKYLECNCKTKLERISHLLFSYCKFKVFVYNNRILSTKF